MNEVLEFKYIYEHEEHTFPLFKFLKPEHAQRMLEHGEIYLPLLSNFKKKASDESLLNDDREGVFDFEDKFTYQGPWDEAHPILRQCFPQVSVINVKDFKLVARGLNLTDAWVYCTSGLLLSDSLIWALKEGKTSCVMITEPQKLRELLQKKIKNSDFSHFLSCEYSDERKANQKTDLGQFYFYKGKKFERQREVRLVGQFADGANDLKDKTLCIPEIKKYLLEIDFSKVDEAIVSEKKAGEIINKVIKKDGTICEFKIDKPFGIHSLVILENSMIKKQLGFIDFFQTGIYGGASTSNCDICLGSSSLFAMFCFNKIEDINKIVIETSAT